VDADAGLAGGATPDAVDQDDLSRILTVPNLISFVRLLGVPVFLYLLIGRDNKAAAGLLLAVLGGTDWVDGWYARRYHQVSNLGKALDPVVDRVVLIVGIVAAIATDSAPLVFAVLVLVREVLVATWTLSITALGAVRMDVTWWGKAGTFANYFAFPLFMIGASTIEIAPLFEAAGWIAAVPGLVLSYVAGFQYIPLGRKALREGRAARRLGSEDDTTTTDEDLT
jgi:cardiolipin synthase (CMP-forming)